MRAGRRVPPASARRSPFRRAPLPRLTVKVRSIVIAYQWVLMKFSAADDGKMSCSEGLRDRCVGLTQKFDC
jgi:hypothetical protein